MSYFTSKTSAYFSVFGTCAAIQLIPRDQYNFPKNPRINRNFKKNINVISLVAHLIPSTCKKCNFTKDQKLYYFVPIGTKLGLLKILSTLSQQICELELLIFVQHNTPSKDESSPKTSFS